MAPGAKRVYNDYQDGVRAQEYAQAVAQKNQRNIEWGNKVSGGVARWWEGLKSAVSNRNPNPIQNPKMPSGPALSAPPMTADQSQKLRGLQRGVLDKTNSRMRVAHNAGTRGQRIGRSLIGLTNPPVESVPQYAAIPFSPPQDAGMVRPPNAWPTATDMGLRPSFAGGESSPSIDLDRGPITDSSTPALTYSGRPSFAMESGQRPGVAPPPVGSAEAPAAIRPSMRGVLSPEGADLAFAGEADAGPATVIPMRGSEYFASGGDRYVTNAPASVGVRPSMTRTMGIDGTEDRRAGTMVRNPNTGPGVAPYVLAEDRGVIAPANPYAGVIRGDTAKIDERKARQNALRESMATRGVRRPSETERIAGIQAQAALGQARAAGQNAKDVAAIEAGGRIGAAKAASKDQYNVVDVPMYEADGETPLKDDNGKVQTEQFVYKNGQMVGADGKNLDPQAEYDATLKVLQKATEDAGFWKSAEERKRISSLQSRLDRLQIEINAGPASEIGSAFRPIAPGYTENGWRFKGGDAGTPENWERV